MADMKEVEDKSAERAQVSSMTRCFSELCTFRGILFFGALSIFDKFEFRVNEFFDDLVFS